MIRYILRRVDGRVLCRPESPGRPIEWLPESFADERMRIHDFITRSGAVRALNTYGNQNVTIVSQEQVIEDFVTVPSVSDQITEYLATGGLFNPEMANHNAVRNLMIHAREELDNLSQMEVELLAG